MDPRAYCTRARVLVVAGKGGVGKTTIAAAFAVVAARAGVRTLLVDVEGTGALPALFGVPGPLDYADRVLAEAGGDLRTPIVARQLTPDDALLEYLDAHGMKRVSKRLTSTGTLDVIATAVPGIKDILVLSKVKAIERAAVSDPAGPELIIVDAPAAGHAVTFLATARGLADAVTVGPIRNQAAEVVEMIADPTRCQVVLVTLPEETPVNEAVETAYLLEDRAGVVLAPVVVNGLWPHLELAGAATVTAAAGARLSAAEMDAMDRAAAFRRGRQGLQDTQVARLAAQLPLPQLHVPYVFTTELGRLELGVLADALAAGMETIPA